MGWFSHLFRRPAPPPSAEDPDGSRTGYRQLPGPSGGYRLIEFFDLDRNIRRTVVDDRGRIRGFPGIEDEARVRALVGHGSLEPVTRYYAGVGKRSDGQYVLYWTVQPDGRYWADDDGFGMEDDEEVVLYALLDENGRFKTPFRLYSVGQKQYADAP